MKECVTIKNCMTGVAGFEPTITESKSVALPFGYTPLADDFLASTYYYYYLCNIFVFFYYCPICQHPSQLLIFYIHKIIPVILTTVGCIAFSCLCFRQLYIFCNAFVCVSTIFSFMNFTYLIISNMIIPQLFITILNTT